MATTMTQDQLYDMGGPSLVDTDLTGTTQDIKARLLVGNITISVALGGTPNAEITATSGSLHFDRTNTLWYINATDSSSDETATGTTWTEMGDLT
jgi:hypothetical protein